MRPSFLSILRSRSVNYSGRSTWNGLIGPGTRTVIATAVLFAFVAGCKPPNAGAPSTLPPPTVSVALPIQQEVVGWDEFTGRLDAVESVEVRARVSGEVVATPFEEGAIVKRGTVLFEIDPRPFQADLDEKTADIERAKAQVDIATIEFHRVERLRPDNATLDEVENATSVLRQAQAALAGARAAVESSRLDVEWSRVVAPITGRVSRKYVTTGNMVTGGTGTGTLLTTIMSVESVYCYVDVDERSLLNYQRLAQERKLADARETKIPCFLQLANETGFPHEGVIDFLDNRIDPATATLRVRGVFPNPGGWLTPGSFARLRIPGTQRYTALLVPESAVTMDQNQKNLLVIGAENKVEGRAVKLGRLFGDLREIEAGIGPSDRVVVNGLMQARPGMTVHPQETPIASVTFDLTGADPHRLVQHSSGDGTSASAAETGQHASGATRTPSSRPSGAPVVGPAAVGGNLR